MIPASLDYQITYNPEKNLPGVDPSRISNLDLRIWADHLAIFMQGYLLGANIPVSGSCCKKVNRCEDGVLVLVPWYSADGTLFGWYMVRRVDNVWSDRSSRGDM